MTTDAPRQAALNTTEILENILSYLPNRTVFGVQRVCRQWRDVISGSPTIQDKLFLRLRGQTPETWLLTNPQTLDQMMDHIFPSERPVEMKFRMADATDIQAVKVKFSHSRIIDLSMLFTPVTLNPLLQCGQQIEEEDIEFMIRVSSSGNLAHFAQPGSSRATFITDPPLTECTVHLDFKARPSCPDFYYLGSIAKIRSDKPLTLGEAIDRSLESKQMRIRSTKKQGESVDVTEDITVAEKIVELEKQHNCKTVLDAVHIKFGLNNTIVRPLPLTDAEYLRYRPKGDEPIASSDDSSESDAGDGDSSGDGSSEDELAEDEPTEPSSQ
jgi:hypothetical protein